jgi:hypothetical protein
MTSRTILQSRQLDTLPLENVLGSYSAAFATFVKGPIATMETVSSGSWANNFKISIYAGSDEGIKCRGGLSSTSSQE